MLLNVPTESGQDNAPAFLYPIRNGTTTGEEESREDPTNDALRLPHEPTSMTIKFSISSAMSFVHYNGISIPLLKPLIFQPIGNTRTLVYRLIMSLGHHAWSLPKS